MAQLSDRLNRLAPSATLAMSQKSSEMKAQGIDVINMSVGEPDFNTPDHIKLAAKQAIDDNYSRYSPVPGYADLRKAITEKLKRENALDYSASEILVSNGAKQSVCNAIMALVNPGDEVIIPAPYWVSYPQMVLLAGGTPVFVNAGFEQDFKMTAQQLEAAITPKTRMLILCSPSNPTGSVYGKEELKALADVILSHDDLFVLADERTHQLHRSSREHRPVPGHEGARHYYKWCVESIRHDRLAHRLHGRAGVDSEGLQQATGTVHKRSLLGKPEDRRGCLHRKSGVRGADATSL